MKTALPISPSGQKGHKDNMTSYADTLQLHAARFDLHARTILSVILDNGGAVTDAVLYFAMAKNRLTCDDASGIVDFLFKERLLKRVGNVAVAVTDEGVRYAEGVKDHR